MGKHFVFLACLLAGDVCAATWRPPERLLHAVRLVESADGLFTWGDNGQSLGDYQLSEAAWLDVSSWRRSRNLPTFDYDQVWDSAISHAYAADYLSILHNELKKRLNRPPTVSQIYAAYNMGLTSFAQCRYQLTRVNPVTARKCQQIEAIMAGR